MAEENKSAIESSEQTIAKSDIKELSENDVQALAETAQSVDKVLGLDNIKKFLDCFVNAKETENYEYLLGTENGKLRRRRVDSIISLNSMFLCDLLCTIIQAISGKSAVYSFVNSDEGDSVYIVDGETKTLGAGEKVSGVCDSLNFNNDGFYFKEIFVVGDCFANLRDNDAINYTLEKYTWICSSDFHYNANLAFFKRVNMRFLTLIGGKPTDLHAFVISTYEGRPGGEKIEKLILQFDTSECIDFSVAFGGTFENDIDIEAIIKNWDTSNGTDFSAMFSYCSSLTTLNLGDKFDTSNGTDFSVMFSDCSSLTTLNLGDKFDIYNTTNVNYMFRGCTKLTNVSGTIKNILISLDLSDCPLTRESALVFINGLSSITTSQTLTLSSTTKALLTDDDIAIATSKGWTIA